MTPERSQQERLPELRERLSRGDQTRRQSDETYDLPNDASSQSTPSGSVRRSNFSQRSDEHEWSIYWGSSQWRVAKTVLS